MIRLNLGCGDKILENYINVDVASERKGKKPDVISDIRKLTFDDNYADEILSVHVIEHFWRWEVSDILKEWISERLNIDFINSHYRKDRYKLPRNERPSIDQTPDIVRDIFSIEFFDSVIAIKKRTKIEPLRIRK